MLRGVIIFSRLSLRKVARALRRRGVASPALQDDLIFDLGVNRGEDSEFYLAKGFRVVAVEANPVLFGQTAERLSNWIDSKQLVLLNLGVWSEPKTLTFYLNEDNDHWSSFDPTYGTRDGTRYRTLDIRCITVPHLLREYGVPHYMKIDIEGADRLVLAQLRGSSPLPHYVSVEEYGVAAIRDLAAIGYSRFQIVPQGNKSWAVPPNPPREGRYVERHFSGADSGLFGAELPGEWQNLEAAISSFTQRVRRADGSYVGPAGEWHDIHAAL